ncbi:MAG: sulfurtransferase TusA family protein [Acidobacteriota bacterium]|jgi:tRNA 2-thiouridine synthesizing protein A
MTVATADHRLDEIPAAEVVVDAVGMFCPIPIVRTADRVRSLSRGAILELRADDRVALIDLPNWCRAWGHRYLGWVADGGELRLFVEVGPGRNPRRQAGRGGVDGT